MKRILAALVAVLLVLSASPAAAAGGATIDATRDGSTVTVSYTAPDRFDNLWLNVDCGVTFDAWAQVRYGLLDESSHVFENVPTDCEALLREPVMRHWGREWRVLASIEVLP